jgi:hypothetical protein
MNKKQIIYIIAGTSIFIVIWLFNMLGGVSLLIGFGFGILMHNFVTSFFKKWQRGIYLNEKKDMEHRKVEIEAELKQLEKDK